MVQSLRNRHRPQEMERPLRPVEIRNSEARSSRQESLRLKVPQSHQPLQLPLPVLRNRRERNRCHPEFVRDYRMGDCERARNGFCRRFGGIRHTWEYHRFELLFRVRFRIRGRGRFSTSARDGGLHNGFRTQPLANAWLHCLGGVIPRHGTCGTPAIVRMERGPRFWRRRRAPGGSNQDYDQQDAGCPSHNRVNHRSDQSR